MMGNILDNTTELYLIKYTFGEIFSSGGATLCKNPSDQTVVKFIGHHAHASGEHLIKIRLLEQENERLGRKVRGLEQQLSELEILHSKRVIITKFPVCCCISGQTGSANSRQEVLFLGSRSFARTKKRKGKRKLSAKRSCETN